MAYVVISVEGIQTLDAAHTDNEVNLGSKMKGQVFMTHKLVHFNLLDDSMFSYSLILTLNFDKKKKNENQTIVGAERSIRGFSRDERQQTEGDKELHAY